MQTVSIIREKFMKKIIVTFIATITAALLLCFSVSAFDNNDYGGGGGYDYGGGDYGGGYDYGGNDYDSSSYSGDTDPVSVITGKDRTGRCLPLREHRYRYGLPYLV